MLHYHSPAVKKLKQLNTHFIPSFSRKVGGLNFKTTQYSIKIIDMLYFYVFKYKSYLTLYRFKQPDWTIFELPELLYDNISYFSSLNTKFDTPSIIESTFSNNIDDIGYKKTPNILTDMILDNTSVVDIMVIFLLKTGVIFCPFLESIIIFPYIVSSYMGTIVNSADNYFSVINSSIFVGGSFCYIPKDVICNINLSTYFKTYSEGFAQFERTLMILGEDSIGFYIEGCSASTFLESQLHIALVELLVKDGSILNYITLQNWYRGNQLGEGGLYNFTTKRGWCSRFSTLNWVQIEMGSAITWKYPSTFLIGNNSVSRFFSLALVSDFQISDTGNKMIHIGSFTKSKVFSKSISLNKSMYTYRGMVKVFKQAECIYSYIECDSLLLGNNTYNSTIPYIISDNYSSFINQEASISKIEFDFIFFLSQRGIPKETALAMLLHGFCNKIYVQLPLELESEVSLLFSFYSKLYF